MQTCLQIFNRKILSNPFPNHSFARKLLLVSIPSIISLGASLAIAAEVDSPPEPASVAPIAPSAPKATHPAAAKAPLLTPPAMDQEPGENEPVAGEKGAEEVKLVVKSATSLRLETRLSLGTSLGWAVVKPSKGSFVGLGTSDISVQWRLVPEVTGPLYVTGRYAPFVGVWTFDKRDYDATLHGLYGGAEYRIPAGKATVKIGAELGYLLIYAKAQDKTKVPSSVTKGKVNLSAGGGADWGFASNKVLVGPFARVHVIGFSIFNVGASARFRILRRSSCHHIGL